jgi:hypothetical protein
MAGAVPNGGHQAQVGGRHAAARWWWPGSPAGGGLVAPPPFACACAAAPGRAPVELRAPCGPTPDTGHAHLLLPGSLEPRSKVHTGLLASALRGWLVVCMAGGHPLAWRLHSQLGGAQQVGSRMLWERPALCGFPSVQVSMLAAWRLTSWSVWSITRGRVGSGYSDPGRVVAALMVPAPALEASKDASRGADTCIHGVTV